MEKNWEKIKNITKRFKDLAALGFANIAATGIGGIFWFYIASLVGVEKYGEISYFIAIASIVGVISMLGISNTITVYTSKGEKILPHLSFIAIISSTIAALCLFFIIHNVGTSLYVFGYMLFALASSEILGKKLYKEYSKYLITQRILTVVLALLLYHLMGYQGIIIGISIAFLPYSIRVFRSFKKIKIDFSVIKSKRSFMINSYSLDLSRVFSGAIDKIIILPLFGLTILGNYQLGIQFLSLLILVPGIVYQYTLPHDSTGNRNEKLKKITILASVLLAVLGIFLAPLILPVMFPKFSKAIEVIQIMSLGVIPVTIISTYISKFMGSLKSKVVLIGSLIYIVIQILSILILGKLFGIHGVAAAIVLANASEAIYLILIDRRIKNKDSAESIL